MRRVPGLNYNVDMSPQLRQQIASLLSTHKVASSCSDRKTPFGHSTSRGSSIKEKLAKALSKRRNTLLPHHLGRKTTKTAFDLNGVGTAIGNVGHQVAEGVRNLKLPEAASGLDWKLPLAGAGIGAGMGLLSGKKKGRNMLMGAAAGGLAGMGLNMLRPQETPTATPPPPPGVPAPAANGPVSDVPMANGVRTDNPGIMDRMGDAFNRGPQGTPGYLSSSVTGFAAPMLARNPTSAFAGGAILSGANNASGILNEAYNQGGLSKVPQVYNQGVQSLMADKAVDTNYGKEMAARVGPEAVNLITGQTPVLQTPTAAVRSFNGVSNVNADPLYSTKQTTQDGTWTSPSSSAYAEGPNQLLNQAQRLTAGLVRQNPTAGGHYNYEVNPSGKVTLRDVATQSAVPRNVQELSQLQARDPATAAQVLASLKQYLPSQYDQIMQDMAAR